MSGNVPQGERKRRCNIS